MTLISGGSRLALALASVAAVGVSQLGGMSAAQAATVSAAPGVTAGFNGVVRTVTYANGVAYVGGDFTAALQGGQTITRNHLAAVNEATGQLLPWNPGADGSVRSVTVDSGWVYVGGAFSRVGGQVHARLARVAASTAAVDTQFAPRLNGTVKAVAASGATVYAGGYFTTANGLSHPYLAGFVASSGALSPTWQPVVDNFVWGLTVANGHVYAGGDFTRVNGSTRGGFLASLDPVNASLQSGFTPGVGYRVIGIAATSTRIYVAADGQGGHLLALNPDGSRRWTVTADGAFQGVAVLGDTVYGGGHFDNVCTSGQNGQNGDCVGGLVSRTKLAAVNATDGVLQLWAPQGNSALGTWSLAADPATGRLAAGGEWTTFNSGRIQQPHFAQFG